MPRTVDKARRRAELLDAAVDAIAERGLDGVTLMDVARRADVTTGTIGYYFRDKEELLIATLEQLSQRLTDGDAPSLTFFAGDLGLYLPLDDETRRLWRVWLAYCGAAATSPALLAAYEIFYSAIEDRVTAHLDERGIDEPREVAGAIVAAVDGIGLCATVAPELWPEHRQIATMNRILAPLLDRTTPSTRTTGI